MAGTTYKWVSEQRLLYFTQKLKQHFPSFADLIDDSVSVLTKTYSSNKIDTLLSNKIDADGTKGLSQNDFTDAYKKMLDDWDLTSIIDDSATSTTTNKTFSVSKIMSLISAATGIQFVKVTKLPDTGENGKIYLVPNGGVNPNVYDEYVWISEDSTWEKIGTTEIDLSGYVQHSDMIEITTDEIDAIMSTVFGD